MNSILIIFIVFLLLSTYIIWIIIKSFITKLLSARDVTSGLVTLVIAAIFIATISMFLDLNTELQDSRIVVTKERISEINYQDSTINDSLLYGIIKDLRVPHAKIVFAQAKLESASYKSELFRSNKNLFGMKIATIRPTITTMNNYGYQMYHSWRESVVDYLIWQLTNGISKVSDEKYFQYLSEVYAEDPNYVPKLKQIISKNEQNFSKWH